MANDEPIVDRETAEHEFERFCEAMDLDTSKEGMDEEDLASFNDGKRRFVREVMAGRVALNDRCEPVFTPLNGEPITFREPTGAAMTSMDTKKKGHDFGKLHEFAASITGMHPKRFASMSNREIKVVYAVAGLYMGG